MCEGVQTESSVSIYDGEQLLGTADVSADGRWSFTVEGVAVRDHVFKAGTLNGSAVSNSWAVTVVQPPLYEGFDTLPGGEIISGRPKEFPTMTVYKLSGADTIVATDAYKKDPPFLTGFQLVIQRRNWDVTANCKVLLKFKRQVRSVKFAIGGPNRCRVWCYSQAGTVVCDGLTPSREEAFSVWAEFSPRAPYENELIAKIEIEGSGAAWLDNFTLS